MNSAAGNSITSQSFASTAPRIRHCKFENTDSGHLFVDNVRFLSMAAVVALHCAVGLASFAGVTSESFLTTMVQPFKFGTVGFFLISGFLMAQGLQRRSHLDYMRRRVRTVFAPWMVWFSSYFLLKLVWGLAKNWDLFPSFGQRASFALDTLHLSLFGTAFWFVPNLLLGVCLIVFCRRFLDDLRFGFALMAVSLFYGLNMHAEWIPLESHTEALFGFTFYLWLGAWVAIHKAAFDRWLSSITVSQLVVAAIVSGVAGVRETSRLIVLGTTDPANTLRISNQLFSMAVVLLIYKASRAITPRFVDARTSTFGIYLSHTLILSLLMSLSYHAHVLDFFSRSGRVNGVVVGAYVLCGFVMTYSIALLLTGWLLKYRSLSWIVGGTAFRSQKALPLPGRRTGSKREAESVVYGNS
jgi:hypothetical protein